MTVIPCLRICLSVPFFLLGLWSDVYSLCCVIRHMVDRRHSSSPVPLVGLVCYFNASHVGGFSPFVFLWFALFHAVVFCFLLVGWWADLGFSDIGNGLVRAWRRLLGLFSRRHSTREEG